MRQQISVFGRASLLVLLLFCQPADLCAQQQYQGPYAALLRQITLHNPMTGISYDYILQLKNMKTGKVEDQVKGRLYLGEERYVDSNEIFTVNKGLRYYCKLNHVQHTAEVYDIELLKQRLGRKVADNKPAGVIDISSSAFAASSTITVDSLSDRKKYLISIRLKQQQLTAMQLEVNKADYKLLTASFELIDRDFYSAADEDYRKIYQIARIRYASMPASMDQSKLFTITAGKVNLSRPYMKYTLSSLVK